MGLRAGGKGNPVGSTWQSADGEAPASAALHHHHVLSILVDEGYWVKAVVGGIGFNTYRAPTDVPEILPEETGAAAHNHLGGGINIVNQVILSAVVSLRKS